MANIDQVIEAAEEAGWVQAECIHNETPGTRHLALDYPRALGNGTIGSFWRIHIDLNKVPRIAYTGGTGVPDGRASLTKAIEFARQIAADHPKQT